MYDIGVGCFSAPDEDGATVSVCISE
jgi:hypothetical protein